MKSHLSPDSWPVIGISDLSQFGKRMASGIVAQSVRQLCAAGRPARRPLRVKKRPGPIRGPTRREPPRRAAPGQGRLRLRPIRPRPGSTCEHPAPGHRSAVPSVGRTGGHGRHVRTSLYAFRSTLSRLVDTAVQRGGHRCWGDCVMILATTALRISAVAGLQVGDVNLARGLLTVRMQTYPARGGLVTRETKDGPPTRLALMPAASAYCMKRFTASRCRSRSGPPRPASRRRACQWPLTGGCARSPR